MNIENFSNCYLVVNEETKLANQSALRQKMRNAADNGQNTGSVLAKVGGGIIGLALGGVAGAALGYKAGDGVSTIANAVIDGAQSKADDAYAAQMNAKQKAIDTEKQRLNTLLNAAQNELQQVEKAEESAIKSATPKYVA